MKPLRVLIVEDEAVIAMLLAELLSGMGHEICAVEETEAGAVSAAVRQLPDLMIVDDQLSDGSGVAAVAAILRTGFVPHVFISGARIRGGTPGSIVLQKPFQEADLIRAIQRALAVSPR
jgi:CheY-like chemotaxis protein